MTGGPSRRARAAGGGWWIKCDPTSQRHGGWNWPDLFDAYEPGRPYLWSVGTALSQKNARMARPGDPVLGYAAGEGFRVVVALAEIEAGGVFVPGERPPSLASGLPGGFTVALRPVALLGAPVPLAAVREALRRFEPEFFRTRFGSIFALRRAELQAVLAAARSLDAGLAIPAAWPRPRAPGPRARRGRG